MIRKFRIITLIVASVVLVDYIIEKKANYQIKKAQEKEERKEAINEIMMSRSLRKPESVSEEMIQAHIKHKNSAWNVSMG